jgi:hypothetical protein
MLVGGSRSGKTFLVKRQIVNHALMAEQSRHVVPRYRDNAAWASIGQGTYRRWCAKISPGKRRQQVEEDLSHELHDLMNGVAGLVRRGGRVGRNPKGSHKFRVYASVTQGGLGHEKLSI